jgi:nickel/cobalt transporter (NiCoT) family protein
MSATSSSVQKLFSRAGAAVTATDRMPLAGMFSFILLLHALGWGVLIISIVPQNFHASSTQVFGLGIGVTAYTLGMRHAFDADHIAAIDSTTRKLMSHGDRPVSVGFWFSLGHSSIVFGMCALLAAGAQSLASQVGDDASSLRITLGLVGTTISGLFLYAIGIVNLVILLRVIRVFRRMRHGEVDESSTTEQFTSGGLMTRILGRTTRSVTRPWQMYVVGLLFGLGFDTVTEVSLLVVAGGAATMALPWYAILTLPVLFAAGMSLMDTIDGCFMNVAYGWAFARPVRKVYYNMVITGLSVAVALIIGSIELISILDVEAGIASGPWAAIGSVDLNGAGFAIVGLFLLVWLLGICVWRFGHIEEKWSTAGPADSNPNDEAGRKCVS